METSNIVLHFYQFYYLLDNQCCSERPIELGEIIKTLEKLWKIILQIRSGGENVCL